MSNDLRVKDTPIGSIPQYWEVSPLGSLADIKGRIGWRGYTVEDLRASGPLVIGATQISSDNRLDLSKPVYLSQEKYAESPEITIDRDDILIVKVGNTIGKVAIVPEDIGEACINPNTVLVKRAKVEARFLYYHLTSAYAQHYLRANSLASAQPAINHATIKELLVPVPPITEQRAIAQALGALDDKIELNRRVNETLEATARAIFKSWSWTSILSARRPPAGRHVRRHRRPVPAHFLRLNSRQDPAAWRVRSIGDVVRVAGGSTPPTEEPKYWVGEHSRGLRQKTLRV